MLRVFAPEHDLNLSKDDSRGMPDLPGDRTLEADKRFRLRRSGDTAAHPLRYIT